MTESEFIAQTKSLRRLWGWMIEERYGDKGAQILDGIFDEWWEQFKGLDFQTFERCVQFVRLNFRPTFNEPFPAPEWINRAQEAIAQEHAKVEPETGLENDPKYQKYERLRAIIHKLPAVEFNKLMALARPRAEAKLPAPKGILKNPDAREIAIRGFMQTELVRAYCEQHGIETPI